jgi:TonB family protein
MKKKFSPLLPLLLLLSIVANTQEFEGVIVYRSDIKSKVEGINDKTWNAILAQGDVKTVYIKKDKIKKLSNRAEEYYVPSEQRVYVKFRQRDTLYYIDYADDTSKVKSVSKIAEQKKIAGYDTKGIVIETSNTSHKYFYAPNLYCNPAHWANMTSSHYSILTKETSSIWLEAHTESREYSLTQTCTRLTAQQLDDNLFNLPDLPRKKYILEELMETAEIPDNGFQKYLQKNLNATLGAKYVRFKKGENQASEQVMVTFLISETGRVTNVVVANPKEVHSKLAEEAMRVVNASPVWRPAKIYGEKIPQYYKVPITFNVVKE